MINLRKFETHSDYNVFANSSQYKFHNVSICKQEGDVHYDKELVIVAHFNVPEWYEGSQIRLWHSEGGGSSSSDSPFKSMSIDGVVIVDDSGHTITPTNYTFDTSGDHVVEYTLKKPQISSYLFSSINYITSVSIPNGIETIGDYAFNSSYNLSSITIPDSVTSIGSSAFGGCSSLPVVNNLIYADTYLVGTADSSLSTYTIKNDTKWIGHNAFQYCNATSITIPDSVTSIGSNAFNYCESLTSVTIGNSVTSIGASAFGNCSSLTSITIPNSVTSIGASAFGNCSSLTSITIPNSVTSIGDYVFQNCSSLTSVTIPNSVTSIGYQAFYNCTSLTSITIPNSVTTIGGNAFRYCSGITSVTIGSGVTSINNGAFQYCTSLSSITVDNNNTVYDSRNNCNAIIETSTNTLIVGCKNTVIPNSVTSIGYQAFYNCTSLTSITIPNSVTSIGGSAFNSCESLTSVTIPNSVTSIGNNAFSNCSGLESITVDNNNTVYDSRNNCNAIIETSTNTLIVGCKSTVIPNTVTSIGQYAFQGCSGLISITIPSSVTSIGYASFDGCSSLTGVTIPNSVTNIGNAAFVNCSGLESIISLAVTAPSIGGSTFYNIKRNGTLTVPNGATGYGTWDSQLSQYGWTSNIPFLLRYTKTNGTTITIYTGNTITSAMTKNNSIVTAVVGDACTTIDRGSFGQSATPNITGVTIGSNVTSIGDYAFARAYSLTRITSLAATAPTLGSSVFMSVGSNGTLTVPIGSSGYDTWMAQLTTWTKVEQ